MYFGTYDFLIFLLHLSVTCRSFTVYPHMGFLLRLNENLLKERPLHMAAMSVPSSPPEHVLQHDLIAAAKYAALSPAERWAYAKAMAKHFIPLLEQSADLPYVIYDKVFDAFCQYLDFVDDPAIQSYLAEARASTKAEHLSSRVFAIVAGVIHPDENRFYVHEVA